MTTFCEHDPAFKSQNIKTVKQGDRALMAWDRFSTAEPGYVTVFESIRNSSVYHGDMEVKFEGLTAEAWVMEMDIDWEQND